MKAALALWTSLVLVGAAHADKAMKPPPAASHGAPDGGGFAVPTDPGPARPAGQSVTVKIIDGKLAKDVVRRYLHRNYRKLLVCYERELAAKPTLQGTVLVKFVVAAHGEVTEVAASGLDNTNVEGCVHQVIEQIEFPSPKSETVHVEARIKYTPPPPPPPPKPRKRRG